MAKRVLSIIFLVVSVALLSCNVQKPVNGSAFIAFSPAKGWYKNTSLVFKLDAAETDYPSRSLVFTLQLVETYSYKEDDTLYFALTFHSPENNLYSDTLKVPALMADKSVKQRRSNGIIEMEIPYATNIKNMECGGWEIKIDKCKTISNRKLHKYIAGLGAYITEYGI